MTNVDDDEQVQRLFASLKATLSSLRALRASVEQEWGDEDGVYRFYHQSFKVYRLQGVTTSIVAALHALAPERDLNAWFTQIIAEGTGKRFDNEHNRRWLAETRPIVEAFFHARFFLDMAVKYGGDLDAPPRMMPSGWAALLYLFNLR